MKNTKKQKSSKIKLPYNHKYFQDCFRETYARMIAWNMSFKSQQSWFGSFTFKREIPKDFGYKLLHQFLYNLYNSHQQTVVGTRPLRWIIAEELQIRKVIHFHVLMLAESLDLLSRKRFKYRWESLHNITGFCKILPALEGAAPYLSKYITKDAGLTMGGYWKGIKYPKTVSCCLRNALPSGGSLPEHSDIDL